MNDTNTNEQNYNLQRRPHYADGDKVRIALDYGPYKGVKVTVRDVTPLLTAPGTLLTYYYTLELPNLARIKLAEESIAPLASGEGE